MLRDLETAVGVGIGHLARCKARRQRQAEETPRSVTSRLPSVKADWPAGQPAGALAARVPLARRNRSAIAGFMGRRAILPGPPVERIATFCSILGVPKLAEDPRNQVPPIWPVCTCRRSGDLLGVQSASRGVAWMIDHQIQD